MVISKHVCYFSQVQGIGFRYTAQRLADVHGLGGWVRNEDDGSVELVVEGESKEVEAFLAALAQRMADHIDNITEVDEPPSGLRQFTICY